MRFVGTIIITIFFSLPVFSSLDQLNVERMLKDNKSYIEFMNICMTNFGQNRVKQYQEKFQKIYRHHFNAHVLFLQSDYSNSFKHIRDSQNKHTALYSYVLRNIYLEDAKDILDKLAPNVIRSKSHRARLYLTLGYRDRAVSRNFEKVADATNPKLFSYKLHKYEEAIKFARRAKRYGLLALFESQTVEIKKEIYNHLFEIERESGKKFYGRFLKKSGKEYMNELNKTYVEFEKEEEKASAAKKKAADVKDPKGKKKYDETFELKVTRRVRFRNEKKMAGFLINGEFDRAEDVIRQYVTDFNFKIILATIEIVNARKIDIGGIDLNSLIIHHYDNYSRLLKKKRTLLDEVSSKVRVIDDIDDVDKKEKSEIKEETTDKNKSDEKKEEEKK